MAAQMRAAPRVPADERGLAFQFGVIYRYAQVIEERALLCAKLLEVPAKPRENIERAHRVLADAMALHAAAERLVQDAEDLEQ